jgi:16S rRNA (guanine527-N7)-methyltransferase
MEGLSLILKYFPDLSKAQQEQFAALGPLYADWNSKINVISRKDIEHLYEKHILHSLGIGKVISFVPGTRILDVGTGGGFPGIPLAILFPETDFLLVDSIGKKIRVVNEVVAAAGIKNVKTQHARAEDVRGKFDFVVSRAVTTLYDFIPWVQNKIDRKNNRNKLENGILYLKGGDLTEELKGFRDKAKVFQLSDYFTEEFFETKSVVYLK